MRDEHLTEEEIFASLAYRRVEMRKKGEDWFHQEYPSTPEEAFLTTGNPIFAPTAVRDCYDEKHGAVGRLYRNGRGDVVFEHDSHGPLTIYHTPNPDIRPDRYFIGGDPAETITGDPACMQVINRASLKQVAVYHNHCDPVTFGKDMMLLGDFYGHAMICPEVEGGGMAAIGVIQASDYGNVWTWKKPDRTNTTSTSLGWLTSYQTKRWAIGTLQKLILDRSLLIHDKQTYHELLNFVEHPNGELGNIGRSNHDDTVMALAIAVTASMREGHFNPRNSYQHSTPDIYTTELEAEMGNIFDIASRRYNERAS
jgi:hypothetical protein